MPSGYNTHYRLQRYGQYGQYGQVLTLARTSQVTLATYAIGYLRITQVVMSSKVRLFASCVQSWHRGEDG